MKTTRLLCLLAVLSLGQAWAQGSSEYKAGIKIPLDQDGKRYIRFITWNQMWLRATQNNPGTTNPQGTELKWTPDLGVRRARALWYAQITPRYLVLTHIGINNQTFINGGGSGITGGVGGYGAGKKPQVFLHDFWNEYRVFKTDKESADGKSKTEHNSLFIGTGLHYWNGVSRMGSASTLNFLAVDAPIWNWYNIETTDQFARQFGIYAKGKIASKVDYRFAMNKPFYTDERATARGAASSDPAKSRSYLYANGNFSYAGYVNYQLWDQESNFLPFMVGTYCGTKKVLNVGGGFYYHPDAAVYYTKGLTGSQLDPLVDSATVQNQLNWALDVFMERPLGESGAAVTVYGIFQSNNYGQNYYRNVGIMNTAGPNPYTKNADGTAATFDATTASIDGYGNVRSLTGTGNIAMVQAGFMLPKSLLGEEFSKSCRIQPYAQYTSKQLDWLTTNGFDGRSNCWDAGMNFFMDGHHSKVTVQWSQRPVVSKNAAGDFYKNGSKGELIVQAQVFL